MLPRVKGKPGKVGVNLVPLLKGEGSPAREALFWHYPHYHGSAWTPGAAVRAGDWKLIEFYEKEKIELYDLSSDLGEENDLADAEPEKASELLSLLRRWQSSVEAEMPVPNPDFRPE